MSSRDSTRSSIGGSWARHGSAAWAARAVIAAGALAWIARCPADSPSNSIVSIDRGLQQRLASARALAERGQYADAVHVIEAILGAAEGKLTAVGGQLVDASAETNRLLASLPPAARAVYEKEMGGIARGELERVASTGRIDDLLRVAIVYRHTEAGRRALAAATGIFFDRGQFVEAAAAAHDLLGLWPMDASAAVSPEQSSAAARLVLSWIELGELDRARRWIDGRRTFLSRGTISFDGAGRRLDQWLDERVARATASAQPGMAHGGGSAFSRLAGGGFRRPSAQAVWSRRLGPGGVAATLADEAMARYVDSGIPPFCHCDPVVIGGTVLVRYNDELAAFDVRTGEPRWSRDVSPPGDNPLGNANSTPQHESLVPLTVASMVDRALAGRTHSAISSDGRGVFCIVDDGAEFDPGSRRRRRSFGFDRPRKNSLVCFDIRDGSQIWRLADLSLPGPSVGSGESDHDLDFLGPPLVKGNTLHVLARSKWGPLLLALDPDDGAVRWSLSFAGLSGFDNDGLSLYGPPCVPFEHDGLLVCATPSGLVIAVDVVRRSCRWAYRTDPVDEPVRPFPRFGRFAQSEASWLYGFREAAIRADLGRFFVVVPRSASIAALDADTGATIWKRQVPTGVFLGPLVEGRLIAVGRYRAYAFDASTGAPAWEAPIGLPSGRGFTAEGLYVIPEADGRLTAVDLARGRVAPPGMRARSMPRLGNLVPIADGADETLVVSLWHDRLTLLKSLDRRRAEAADALRKNPGTTDVSRRLALFEREAGDFDGAERRLAALGASGVEIARRDLWETLQMHVETFPARCPELASPLLKSAENDEEKAIALRTIAAAHRRGGQHLRSLDALLELLGLALPGESEADRGPRRTARFDRLVRGDVEDLLAAIPAEQRGPALMRIGRSVESAIRDGDPTRLSRAAAWFCDAGLERPMRRKIAQALRPEPGFWRAHLELWDQSSTGDAQAAAEACRDLAELYQSHGDRKDAAACYRRLLDEFAGARFDDERGPADVAKAASSADPQLGKEISGTAEDPWPQSAPNATTESGGGSSARFFQLPLEILPGSLGERLDIAGSQDGKTLRFQSDEHSAYWDLHLPTPSPQYRAIYLMHRAWSMGRIVIVQLGTELFGVAPFDESGEPSARLLWRVELLGATWPKGNDLVVRFQPGAAGAGAQRIAVIDRLGRAVARVGPVTPGLVCYHDRGTLIALDPLTGKPLWRRDDAPEPDLTSGDRDRIVLMDRRRQRLCLLRSFDGQTIADRSSTSIGSDVRWLAGRDAISQVADAQGTRLARIDLLSGRPRWSRQFPAGTEFTVLDAQTYAATGVDGTIELFRATTGATMATERVAGAERALQVFATGDVRRFYLAFSQPFADSENVRANGQRGDTRSPLLNGVLCAVDRRSGRLLWSRRLDDGVFTIDQSRVAPFLVFSYQHAAKSDDSGETAWPILHVIDKRTGRDVYERTASTQPHSQIFVESNLAQQEVTLHFADGRLRMRYPR